MNKAAPTPWRMEIVNERHAAVFGKNGALVAVMSIEDARMTIEGVNNRMEAERVIYAWDTDAVVRGAYHDDTL
jgi:hypothetical protein